MNTDNNVSKNNPIAMLNELIKAHEGSVDMPEGIVTIPMSLTLLRDLHHTLMFAGFYENYWEK